MKIKVAVLFSLVAYSAIAQADHEIVAKGDNVIIMVLFRNARANTATQTINTPILMRSHTPISGVGPFLGISGASKLVRIPNTISTTIESMV